MTNTSNPALPNGAQDIVAEMRKRLIEKSISGSHASLLRRAAPQNAVPPSPAQHAATTLTAAPAILAPSATVKRSSGSIFDPFANAAPQITTEKVQAPVPQGQPVQAAPTVVQTQAPIPQQASAPISVTVAPPVEAAAAPGPRVATPESALAAHARPGRHSFGVYFAVSAIAALLGIGTVYHANQQYAGEMYGNSPMATAAQAFSEGKNYATFDLNMNIRQLRDQHLMRMKKTPDVILFGASHWQEADETLVTNQDMYNAHIHRDYWEDLFAMFNLLERNGKVPKKLIISLRDNQFMGIEDRRDYLWEPGIPYWREQATKMGIPTEPFFKSYAWQRLRERLSLSLLFNNLARWYNASEHPHVTEKEKFDALDVLLPGGSIRWSRQHDAYFTQERSKEESLTFAEFKKKNPPLVEKRGVKNFEKLVQYIQSKGVKVYFAHPPFNPIYWDAVQNTKYSATLTKFENMVKDIAQRHNIEIVGSFNPYKVGCKAEQYIDAEHSNPTCLANIFNQWMALDAKNTKATTKVN
jgi:hypothetical protein